jgi:hypothetical protein
MVHDTEITEYIYKLRTEGELKDKKEWRWAAVRMVKAKYGISLTTDAVKCRFRRRKKSGGTVTEVTQTGANTAKAFARNVETLEELISRAEIDLDVWRINQHKIKSWGSGARTLFSVGADLERRVPQEPLWPPISPVSVELSPSRGKHAKRDGDAKRAIVCGDAHIGYYRDMRTGGLVPFHDRKAMDVTLKIIEHVQPDRVTLLGDMLDLAEWTTKFARSPEVYWTLQPAIIELAYWLGKVRQAVPDAEIDFIEGNHCARMYKMIIDNLIAAHGLKPADRMDGPAVLSIENLLGLESLGINYVGPYPDGQVWINENLCIEHGTLARSGSGDTTRALLNTTRYSVIVGHIHRLEKAGGTVHAYDRERTYVAGSPGCLCKTDGTVPAQKKKQNWQQGFAYIEYYEGNKLFADHLISIYGGRCLFDGRTFEGKDYITDLQGCTDWKF